MTLMSHQFVCKNCNETMEGDGYTVVYHCPNADTSAGFVPDADPVFCTEPLGNEPQS